MTENPRTLPVRIARVAVVAFAILVLGWLVVNAQRTADGSLHRKATAPSASLATRVPEVPEVTAIVPATNPGYLYGSKSIVLEDPMPTQMVFLPSSKVGRPGVPPPLASTPPAATPPSASRRQD